MTATGFVPYGMQRIREQFEVDIPDELLNGPTKPVYCDDCHQHVLLHAKDCPSKVRPPWLLDERRIDLHRDGDGDCKHVFMPWQILSGTYQLADEQCFVGWMSFSSKCRHCDARVGRRTELVCKDETG